MASTASSGSSSKPASRGKPAAKPSAPTATSTGSAPAAKTRQRIDWEAVERDYRTGRFTLRELEAKHGAQNSTIARRAAKGEWTKDLADAVRQATNAKLIQQAVQQECSSAQQNAATAVLVAAEVNARIIGGHRARLRSLTEAADSAQAKVLELLATADEARDVVALSGALEGMARMTKTLIDKEREAYGISGDETPDNARTSLPLEFVEAQHAED